MVEKQKVLADAVTVLNKEDQPWEAKVEGDTIVAYWKWMDARFFSPGEINDETKEYKFIVTLHDNGKYSEKDIEKQSEASIDVKGNTISFGSSAFAGKEAHKAFVMGVGENKQTGEVGIIKFKFSTGIVKEPIRQYLKDCGWKKKGLFF